ncbi:hypothetical protein CRE_22620 [Caenorhabditis remanei]|uniref:ISXO2-like transposase domain-containing protein n=1 Tax=Caenorhabditis remanei TaxID=31234 RepID=E3N8S4_CAERE|nr:hypothetical protein CRE_22620 [Caenorhabditis remanei]
MKKSIRKDSFFQGLRLSVHQILYLAADFIENPTRHLEEIADSFQIDKNTVSEVHEWFRDLTQQWFVRTIEDNPVKMLGGKGKFVEIDETAMFRAKYNRGHMVDRPTVWVFGLLERQTNKIAMFQVVKRDARILLPIIRRHVKPGTTIISDGWAAYRRISQIPGRRYKHKVINHKLHFVSPTDPTVHTQGIEASWGALKSSLKSRHGIRDYMAKGHLYNYIFRRYNNKDKLLNRLIMEMGYYNRAQATLVPNDFDELHPAEDSDYSDDDNDKDNDDNEDVEDDEDDDENEDVEDDEDDDENDDDNQSDIRGEEDDNDNDSDEHRDRQDDNGGDDEGDDEDEDDDDDEDEEEEEEDDDHENDDKDESEDEGKEADRRETRTRHHSSNDGSDSDGLNESGNNKLRRPANANSRTVQSSSSSSSSDADSSESEYVLPRSSRFGQRMQKFDKPSSSSGPSNEKTKVNNVKDSKSSKKQKSRQKNAPQSTSPALARSRNSSPLSSAAEKAEIIHGTSKASIRRTQRGKGRRDGMVFSAEIRQQQMDKNHRNSGKKPARGKGSRGGKVANQLRKEKEDRLSRARDEEANEDEEAEERRNLIAEKTKKTGSKKTKKAKELGKAETQDANPIAGRTRNAAATKTKEGNEVEEAEAPISERTRNAGTKEPKGQGKKKKNGGKGKKNGSKKKN